MTTATDKETKVTIKSGDQEVETTLGTIEEIAGSGPYAFPDPAMLFIGETTLADAPELTELVTLLRDSCEEFDFLGGRTIRVLWKDTKNLTWLAKISMKGEEDRLLSGVEFTVKVNIRACRPRALTRRQVEAMLHHQLCHFVEDENGRILPRGHDVEEFGETIGRYGAWRNELKAFGEQLALWSE